MPKRTVIHANATIEGGLGHLMRALAIAQDAAARGWAVEIVGDILPTARERALMMAPGIQIHSVASEEIIEELRAAATSADVLHLDTYETVADLVGTGTLISNMQDGPFGARDADLTIDANLDAEEWFARPAAHTHCLVGIEAAVIREQARAQRKVPRERAARPRVLVVMGGTDPRLLTGSVLKGLARIQTPLEVTVVAAADRHSALRGLTTGSPHCITFTAFASDLPALARRQTLVITASGTSVWDFACLGVPMALVCAVDNQRRGYQAALEAELGIGLGEPPHADLADRVANLESHLSDQAQLEGYATRAAELVDGLGTWRIISAWEELTAQRTTTLHTDTCFARPATIEDAQILFAWRNDDAARSNSRSHDELIWEEHVAWLEQCLGDSDRVLLLVSAGTTDIGTVRWDRQSARDWEVSITVSPHSRGKGLASAVLSAGEQALQVDGAVRMLASIHTNNDASRKLFQRAGYLPYLPADDDGFETRAKWRFADDPA